MERCGGRAVRRWGAALTASAAAVAITLPAATAQAADGPAGIGAKGAYLLDSGANRPLWSRAADTRRQMASTTKIMTAVVVLDGHAADLDKQITVKQAYRDWVADHAASTADLRTGDKLTVRQLLYGLMLPSGCDAAYALADTFGSGDTEEERAESFIGKMNEKAVELGLRNTHYDSFDGISAHGGNYTTPRDLAQLSRHALGNGTFATVMKSMSVVQKAKNVDRIYTWYNTNKLLGSYQGVIGIKTGSTRAAGPCLTFAARRGGRTVVGVILNDPTGRYPDAAKMLDYAFRTRTPMKLRQLPFGAHED
ncbi:D-alanyl-D-alanine carboxypeptidase (penicillin-binding protein 5/6) [Streptomyces olivoverticillatus]|uniref:D-alanyl-D-alanine carboxypeptidase (Penicillin-binding protein 5/6) n=1 Tax=Streptomyces olivoverticillatus TaxID=66427 RepID=A0A7W7LNA2_9ACTN|nr:serine hydrolase [Streptomyces olivoverticillatus]MBB4893409.1 D-alanyl-D-alanine carboxypeptidase (penicillin-binding protein 5/6) [Streptomyces olivoverticillatus]